MSENSSAKLYKPLEELNPAVELYQPYIESGRMVPVGTRSSLGTYLKDTWARRFYIFADSRAKARTQENQHKLGIWWSVLRPVADAIFFWLMFAVVLKTSNGLKNYTAFILIGVLMFQYFSISMTSNANVMRGGRGMIKSFSFPRISIPLALAVRNVMNFMPVLLVVLVSIILIPPHAYPTFAWLLVIPLFALCVVFNTGLGLIIARFAYTFPDLQHLISLATRVLMYGSAVIFPIERFVHHPVMLQIINMNPIYEFLSLFRSALIDGTAGDPKLWLYFIAWTLGVTVVGVLVFWRAEESFGRERN